MNRKPRERKSNKKALNDDGSEPPVKPKKRRGSAANAASRATPNALGPNGGNDPMMVPQPISSYGDTLYASNPFDDTPSMPQHGGGMPPNIGPMGGPHGPPMSHHGGMPGNCMMGMGGSRHPGGPMPPGHMMSRNGPIPAGMMGSGGMPPSSQPPPGMIPGRTYPPEQSMVFNPANPSAPPIYPCGVCHKEVHDNDQGILCESGCNFWFHRACTGLSERAFCMITQEVYAEWVCDNCLNNKHIPLIKFKP